MNPEIIRAIEQIAEEKGISKEYLVQGMEIALQSAYKKNFEHDEEIRVNINREDGKIRVFNVRTVVEDDHEEADMRKCIPLSEAEEMEPPMELGEVIEVEVTDKVDRSGRVAAQTAKQVMMQKIREAEREIIFKDFIKLQGQVVTATIQRVEKHSALLLIKQAEAMLPNREQIPGERYSLKDRIRVLIDQVDKTSKGPLIMVSRAAPGFVKRLFEDEIPEIQDGIIEVKAVSREPGSRTKIAVYSKDKNIDPVGACVGIRGSRIKNILAEIHHEKIDIIRWNENMKDFIIQALRPAEVITVKLNAAENEAVVVVPNTQLSLAIGKEGQNVRLAAKLTDCKIDIKSEAQYMKVLEEQKETFFIEE